MMRPLRPHTLPAPPSARTSRFAMNRFRLPLLCALVSAAPLLADSTFTYTLSGTQATLTGFTATAAASGALTIPATVDGYSVVGIARGAFKTRTALTSIAFTGSTVVQVGPQAFQGCSGLVSASLPAGLATVPAGAFLGCASLTAVTLPSGLTAIEAAAFADCAQLASLTLPAGLTGLGENTFQNCARLGAVALPAGLATVPAHAFAGCSALASVTLPSGLVTIGTGAFADADALTTLTLPASVVTLGAEAFRACDRLATVTLGAGLVSIGTDAFADCPALAAFAVAAGNPAYSAASGALFDAAGATLLRLPPAYAGTYGVPSEVNTFAAGAFAHCAALTGVTLPAGLTALPEGAFYYASGLTELTLPANLVSIGPWAFGGCSALGTVTLPASVTTVQDDAFHYAASLTRATFAGDAPTMGTAVFDDTAAGFTVYYGATATGFASPTWLGYAAQVLGASSALADWLVAQGYTATTDLTSDPDGDGVPLLLAYAFGLNPATQLAASLPQPEVVDDYLALSYYASAEGITYTPQTSTDLQTWTTEGITRIGPDAEGHTTPLVPLSTARALLRVVVQVSQ